MFGRTGAPTKRGPTRGPANFCLGVTLTTLSLCMSCEFSRAVKSIKLTVMSKKGHFLGGKKMGGGIRERPHIFSEQAPA